jgi:hypothetical protein
VSDPLELLSAAVHPWVIPGSDEGLIALVLTTRSPQGIRETQPPMLLDRIGAQGLVELLQAALGQSVRTPPEGPAH